MDPNLLNQITNKIIGKFETKLKILKNIYWMWII